MVDESFFLKYFRDAWNYQKSVHRFNGIHLYLHGILRIATRYILISFVLVSIRNGRRFFNYFGGESSQIFVLKFHRLTFLIFSSCFDACVSFDFRAYTDHRDAEQKPLNKHFRRMNVGCLSLSVMLFCCFSMRNNANDEYIIFNSRKKNINLFRASTGLVYYCTYIYILLIYLLSSEQFFFRRERRQYPREHQDIGGENRWKLLCEIVLEGVAHCTVVWFESSKLETEKVCDSH